MIEKTIEAQLIVAKINKSHYTIINIYLGHKDRQLGLEKFQTFLLKAKKTKYPIISCGDYNINLLKF